MNLKTLIYISRKLSNGGKRSGLLNFARYASLFSIILGTMALLVAFAVLSGYESKLYENAMKFTSHITVNSYNNNSLPEYELNVSRLKNSFPIISEISPINQGQVLIKGEEYVEGMLLKGMQKDINHIERNLIKGQFPKQGKDLAISKIVARRLNVNIGDEIVLYALKGTNSKDIINSKVAKFKLVGIYSTGMLKYDESVIFTTFDAASNFFDLESNACTSLEMKLYNTDNISNLNREMEAKMGYPFLFLTVFDLHNSEFTWIKLQKKPIPLILGMISIVAILSIVTTLLISVVEKTHSIGVLRALGMRSKEIILIFVSQGVFLAAMGTFIGAILAFTLCYLQQEFAIIKTEGSVYLLESIPIKMELWHYELVLIASLLFSVLATLLPSLAALKVSPIRVLRFQ